MGRPAKSLSEKRVVITIPVWLLDKTRELNCESVEDAFKKLEEELEKEKNKRYRIEEKTDFIAKATYDNTLIPEQKLEKIKEALQEILNIHNEEVYKKHPNLKTQTQA